MIKPDGKHRVSKTDTYLNVAEAFAYRSTCIKRKYGAVIVKNDVVVSTGYNGSPRGYDNCCDIGTCLRMERNMHQGEGYDICRAIHAEQNAIIQAGQDRCKGSTMYIWGHNFICILCKRFIVQSGIKDVVLRKDENSPVLHVTVDDIRRELEEE